MLPKPCSSYTVHFPEDKQYGGRNATDGTWSGMVGDLINNVYFYLVATLTITYL